MGDFYQISNQTTLGRSEAQILGEREADGARHPELRTAGAAAALKDAKGRSCTTRCRGPSGSCRAARTITAEETMHLLSSVRLGRFRSVSWAGSRFPTSTCCSSTRSRAHLQKLHQTSLESKDPQRRPGRVPPRPP